MQPRVKLVTVLNRTLKYVHRMVISPFKGPGRINTWLQDKGDSTLRLNYDLKESSIVFDIGGYVGDWSGAIFNLYHCNIYIFEPVRSFADRISIRFKDQEKIHVHNFGLSDNTIETNIHLHEDGSSIFSKSNRTELIRLVSVKEFLKNNNIGEIDLMKINIEGGEYDLLDQLISSGLIQDIENIQVQFHDFAPDAEARMNRIQKQLSETHYLTYQYPFVWENWRRKP